MPRPLQRALAESYEAYRDAIWGACYRLTGTAQDADDLTQETFLRLRERPPDDLDEPLRNWLLTVAANLCRDRLRQRERISYTGQWLPEPAAFDESTDWFLSEGRALGQESPEKQMVRLESVSYAFLLALEQLSANQRSVLLLRDVYDFSVRETAQALEMSTSNVKTTHHRARKRLDNVERSTPRKPAQDREATQALLDDFLGCITSGDFARLKEIFRDDVRLLSDGGDGEFSAATRPVVGATSVAAFLAGITRHSDVKAVHQVILNGLPALVIDLEPASPRQPPRAVARIEVDANRRICELHFLLSSSKTAGLDS